MREVKPLPETVRSSMRSGVILYDLTRVVEELVFNSLDAGATKVSVFVGVGTCYVKVVDDGCGITRDGLVLLGERYATSKFDQFVEADTASGSFGSRGEALASISDVSLLEVVTKPSGRPNGYRKVMKGFKCLYLGIDDDRKDVGTTVVVRDLFYNQPVRRKCMQSSPKKVLDSVKKCVHRVALVHSKVSFKVVDIESEEELLHTIPSNSPLLLLKSAFGVEVSADLHELNIIDGNLELSGYISSPCSSLPIKAFQYIYINSRFICKGRIHKLLNEMATRFECWDPGKAVDRSQNRKRNKPQSCAAYVLNLSCPRSLYDLTFEPSKTYVEFKDWAPVLDFIDKVIQAFWKKRMACGESICHGANIVEQGQMLEECDNFVSADKRINDIGGNSRKIKNCLASPDLMKILPTEDYHRSQRHVRTPFGYLHENTEDFRGFSDHHNEIEFGHDTDYSFQPRDENLAECLFTETSNRETHPWMSDKKFSVDEDYIMESRSTAAKRSSIVEANILSTPWQTQPFKLLPCISSNSAASGVSYDHHDFSSDAEVTCDLGWPVLKSCSSRGRFPSQGDLFSESRIKFQYDCFGRKRTRDGSYSVDVPEIDCSSKRVRGDSYNILESPDLMSRTLWPEDESNAQLFPRISKIDPFTEFVLSRSHSNSIPSFVERFDATSSEMHIEDIGSSSQTLNTEWYSVASNPLSPNAYLNFEPFLDKSSVKDHYISVKGPTDLLDGEEFDCDVGLDVALKTPTREHCTTHIECGRHYNGSAGSRNFIFQDKVDIDLSAEHLDILADETDWLRQRSHGRNIIGFDTHRRQNDQSKYQDCLKSRVSIRRSIRSHSAPPFHRCKRKYHTLNHPLTTEGNHDAQTFHDSATYPDARNVKNLCQPPSDCHQKLNPTSVQEVLSDTRYEESRDINIGVKKMQNFEMLEQSKVSKIQATASIKESISESQDSPTAGTKWRNCCPQIRNTRKLQGVQDRNDILDICSGFLHLATDSLIPESINKNCLKDCRVLQQVDKKFIPVMAGRTLALIDQHAADERIRLEELRHKVLSGDGEARTITFLDVEQELMLPEISYQLLHNYAKPIQEWGWRCNIQAQRSGSFKRNLNFLHRKPTVITLVAVPCILGVTLSDVDLMEFLQQLSETDGSSTIPPSVLRILNSKACRGAIMFGDSLLPAECSLIVEELKQTSLCFQCAHGRPTTAPLVNLEELHKQTAKIASLHKNNGAGQVWHGLHRHEVSLARAEQRLDSAKS